MKKLVSVIVLFVCITALFAATDPSGADYAKVAAGKYFRPSSYEEWNSLSYKLYNNPASLGAGKFTLQIPAVIVTGFNVAEIVESEDSARAVSNISNFNFENITEDLLALAMNFITSIGSKNSSLFGSDVSLGFTAGKVGIGVDVSAVLRSMPEGDQPTQSLLHTVLVPTVNASLTFAMGFRLAEHNTSYFDFGVSVHYQRKIFTHYSANDVVDNQDDLGQLLDLETMNMHAGWAVPVDLGIVWGINDGKFQLGLSMNNINGNFTMNQYSGVKNAAKLENPAESAEEYKFEIPFELNFSMVIDPGWKVMNPVISLTMDDLTGLAKVMQDTGFDSAAVKEAVLMRATARLSLRLLKILNVSAAFSRGYLGGAAQLDLWGTTVEVKYNYIDMSDIYGQKPVDSLSLMVRLGFKKN